MAKSPWIIDVDVRNFAAEVVERSRTVPVVVDFWATWCGPCKALGPVLERFANEGKGSFVLAKVDTDANPELAQAFQIQGIPTVVAIVGGRPVDGFSGNLPAAEVKAFLERIAPGAATPPEPPALSEAKALAAEGRVGDAIELLRGFLRTEPDHADARTELARMLVDAGRAPEARKVFDKLSEQARATDAARAVEAALAMAEQAGDVAELEAAVSANQDDHGARIGLGRSLIASGRREEGLEHLLEVVKRDRGFEDDAARKAMIEVFEMLGDEDPLTLEFRQRLQMLLLV